MYEIIYTKGEENTAAMLWSSEGYRINGLIDLHSIYVTLHYRICMFTEEILNTFVSTVSLRANFNIQYQHVSLPNCGHWWDMFIILSLYESF